MTLSECVQRTNRVFYFLFPKLNPYFALEVTAEDLSALYCKYTKMEMFLCNGTVHHLGQLLH